ncbi:DUF4097 family beta strand repeat-containing protein [Arachidicoccus sp.]|uniref:DUF4097 family beta strand repeat-containing protein n=1 Tax=Arachidicoccus sp. TaxID=1872624 RepID=UPI003D25A3CF
MKKIFLIIGCALLLNSCIQMNGGRHRTEESVSFESGSKYILLETKYFMASSVKNVQADLISSDIHIVGDATDRAYVTLHVNGSGIASLSAQQLQERANKYYNIQITLLEDGELYISIKPKVDRIFSDNGLSFQVSIHTLPSVAVQVDNVSGDMTLQKLASVKVSAVSGDIELQDIAENVEAGSTSGDITGDNIGSISDVHTVSGDIHLQIKTVGDDIHVKSVSGDVVLKMPNTLGANIDLSSVSGDLNANNFNAVSFSQKSDHHMEGTINGGGKTIVANTVSGNISLN